MVSNLSLGNAAFAIALAFCQILGDGSFNSTVGAETNDGPNTKRILAIFEEISQIPRCSKHEQQISAWLVDWAKRQGLPVKSDHWHNVLITVPASSSYESHPAIVLQAHMDMVCQKAENSGHNFSKDPITLARDGDWLRAEDTTLGADDGIGIAIALALAEDQASHPKLELLFTTDEEIDTTGAAGLSKGFFTGKKMINIDSESEGVITLGSAGGLTIDLTRPMAFSAIGKDDRVLSLRVEALLGGHSGLDIQKNRANAVVLIAQALSQIRPFRMINIDGGTADNAIPRTAQILFTVSQQKVTAVRTQILALEQEARKRYSDESNLSITLASETSEPHQAASEADSKAVIELLMQIPQGVYEWSDQFSGLPETSDNIGIVETKKNSVDVTALARSFDPKKLETIAGVIEAAGRSAGARSMRHSTLPPWPPRTDTVLYKNARAAYERLFRAPLKTEVVHAGLECGYFANADPEMEIISLGPTLENVHTPRERLYVPSLNKVFLLIKDLIAQP